MIDRKKVFLDQPLKNEIKTMENCYWPRDDYQTGCLLDYPYFKENYKVIGIDLSKHQALDADPRAIQQVIFTGNLEHEIQ